MFSGVFFRAAMLCLVIFSFTALNAAAQQVDCNALYEKFLTAKKAAVDLPTYRTALAAGQEHQSKCSSEPDEAIKNYVTKNVPVLADKVKGLELEERFRKAGETNNQAELLASGKELLARKHSASLDIMIVLASIGYDKANGKSSVEMTNEDTIGYAKTVLEKIGSDKSEKYGAYNYRYKTAACTDGAANTSGWMNYIIGYTLVRDKKTKDALPYYYKATQNGCETKNFAEIYQKIGDSYYAESAKLDADRSAKIAAANNTETEETKALDALINGYLDRAADAYARAYKAAETSKTPKEAVYKDLQDVYKARYGEKMEGFDQYLAKVATTAFPDPSSEVKPVASTPPPPTVEPAPAKPVATTPAKPATKTTTKPAKTTKKKTTKK